MAFYQQWPRYVPVARRRKNAASEARKLAKEGRQLCPIQINSRQIANSFWGIAWCNNLEAYADWSNRMPRGRTYARNGSIVDLQIDVGAINALVSGSSLYEVTITIDPLSAERWKAIRSDCAAKVSSLLDLMRGRLPHWVLERLSDPNAGMFPQVKEIAIACSCPDYAILCKHAAATLYGVGFLLDSQPELFFKMRGVDQSELVSEAMSTGRASDLLGLNEHSSLDGEDLEALFGIELALPQDPLGSSPRTSKRKATVQRRASGSRRSEGNLPAATATKSPKKSVTRSKAIAPKKTATTAKQEARESIAKPEKSSSKRTPKVKAESRSAKKPTAKRAAKKPAPKKSVANESAAIETVDIEMVDIKSVAKRAVKKTRKA